MNKPLLLFLSITLIASVISLKSGEVGRNDWHIENIGQLSYAHFLNNKIFYLTHLNVLGHLKLETGEIEYRNTLAQNQRLINVNDKQALFITENNQVITYKVHNAQRFTNNRFVNDRILKSIKSYIVTPDNRLAINDQKNIRIYPLQQSGQQIQSPFADIYTGQPNQLIQKLFVFNNKLFGIILKLKENSNQIVIRQIVNDKLDSHQILLSTIEGTQLNENWSVAEVWQYQQNLVLLLSNNVQNKHQTLVVDRSFASVYQIPKRYNQVIDYQLFFCSRVYNLKTKQQTERLVVHKDTSLNLIYEVQDQGDRVVVFKGDADYAELPKPSTGMKLKKVFAFEKSSFQMYFLVQYCDMTLELYSITSGKVKKLWTRQEGLAYVDKVLFMKYPYSDHLDNEYHRTLLSQSYQQMGIAEKIVHAPAHMALRIKEQVSDLISLIATSINSILANAGSLGSMDWNSISKFTMSEEQQLKLGLKKYILVVTKKDTVYSIDTKTNKVLWKKSKHQKDQKIISLIDLRKDYQLEAAVLITYNRVQQKLIFQQISENGVFIYLDSLPCPIQPSIHKLNHQTITINVGDKTMRYQLGQSHAHEKHFYFYTQEESRIVGWKQIGEDVVEIWNFNLDSEQKIIASASAYKGQQQSFIPLFDNGKVIFKNVDFTNLAILTSKNATSMSLYIINGMTGQVHFNEYRSGLNLNHPVNLAYDENNVIVTYYNNRNKLYEIWTVQEYQEKIQTSAVNMIKDYLQGLEYKPSRNRQNIIFLSQVYGTPISIKKMFISESKESLIRRNLVVITRDDKIYVIGRELVSTRRPKQTALFSNEVYPPYQYLLALDPTKFFSYNLRLFGLENIHFSGSDMESTIFIMAYGVDLFLIRVAPDQHFDTITEDFNYLILVLIMVGVTVGVLVLRHKAVNAKLTRAYRD